MYPGQYRSFFSVPVLHAPSHHEVLAWVEEQRSDGLPVLIADTDEHGAADIRELDFTRPTVLVVGNESSGLTAGWQENCDLLVRIPMMGSASSLNAATACSIVLYEAMRAWHGIPGAARR